MLGLKWQRLAEVHVLHLVLAVTSLNHKLTYTCARPNDPSRHSPTQSAICWGISSSHMAPRRRLCSVLGRSLSVIGKAGGMSRDTHRLVSCGRKHRASMPPSRQAWLAEESSRVSS